MVLPIINTSGAEIGEYANTLGIGIGDIVEIFNFGDVYPTYSKAFEYLWGEQRDGFHHLCNKVTEEDYFGLYNNQFVVKNICVHELTNSSVLLHLRDRIGRNLLIGCKGVKVIKKASQKIKQPSHIVKLPKVT